MARVDLVDVGKTLTGRGEPGERPLRPQAGFRLEHLNLRIPDGRTLVTLWPSGCGKTTLLKLIAGLITPDSGAIRYDDVDMRDVAPGARRIGMVFQNYALYPHVTARTNVLSYFMFRKKTPELSEIAAARYRRTAELMGVELEQLLDRRPPTLSGGEKQRVALGRCITRDPALFLMDEPFSNLDQGLREKYRVNLKILLKQFSITTVYVTHDHHEASILADVLVIMDRGRIEQVGTYQDIYDRPQNAFVAGFLSRHVGIPSIGFIDGRHVPHAAGLGDVRVGVRPEDLGVSREPRPDDIRGVVAGVLPLPLLDATVLSVRVAEHEVHVKVSGRASVMPGDAIGLHARRYHVFDVGSGTRLSTVSTDGA